MTHPIPAGVQRQHAPAVLANRLSGGHRWGRPCLGYNVCVRPDPQAAAALAEVQARARQLEPSLLRVPEHAMHANVAWLLPVHLEFGRAKDELWEQHGPGWVTALTAAVTGMDRFRLCYRQLVATDSAIIAVAGEPNRISELRRQLAPVLRLPRPVSAGGLVHLTLFRYGGRLRDPAALLEWLAAAEVEVEQPVTELLVVRERVFPSLDYEICHRLPLR